MGIGAVGIDGSDRCTRCDHPRLAYTRQNKLLYPVLCERSSLGNRLVCMTKRLIDDTPQRRGGKLVRFELTVCPACFKCLNQIR